MNRAMEGLRRAVVQMVAPEFRYDRDGILLMNAFSSEQESCYTRNKDTLKEFRFLAP